MAFIDVEPSLKTAVEKDKDKKDIKNGESGFANYEQLEEWAEKIRADISIKDHPNGWFAKHLRCAQGQDIYLWILQHAEEDKKSAAIICQKLLEKEFLQAVDENQGRIFNMNNLYRFYMDRDDIADNLIKKWNGDVCDALEVSTNLVALATDVYQQAIVEDEENEGSEEEDENVFDVEAALNSKQYKTYLQEAAQL